MAYYLKYSLKNIEPLRISDDSISEMGQTACLNYIPGTTIRGFIATKLSEAGEFDTYKQKLFSGKTAFLNAYLSVDGKQLIPSPKGFYEDKTIADGEKGIENVVVNGDFDEGFKRAGLGNVASLDFTKGVISYYSVRLNSELKIKIGEENNMFRNAFIEEGQEFCGAIKCDEKEILERIDKILNQESIIIGSSRSSGYGKCEIKTLPIDEEDNYQNYLASQEFSGFAYLYLLSDTVMRGENGEYCGLDIAKLQETLGVEDLCVKYCSTSIRDVRGYNRTIGIRLPSVNMYEKGSVFKLSFSGNISKDRAMALINDGLGERRNEGYGRVLLFDSSYEKLNKKMAAKSAVSTIDSDCKKMPEDDEVLKQVAKNYYRNIIKSASRKYVVDNVRDRGGISSSKARVIEPIIVSNRFDIEAARKMLSDYYKHEGDKQEAGRRQKKSGDIHKSKDHVNEILDTDLNKLLDINTKEPDKIMGIPLSELLNDEETGRIKLDIILSELRYDNKGDKKNGQIQEL